MTTASGNAIELRPRPFLISVSNDDLSRNLQSRARWVAIGLAASATLASFIFFALWILFPELKPFSAQTMKANTSLGLFLGGLAFLFLQPQNFLSPWRKHAGLMSLAGVYFIGLTVLAEYVFKFNLGIDELFVRDYLNPESRLFPGRMSPIAAANFIILGGGLTTMILPHRKLVCPSMFTLPLSLISLTAITGYIFDVPSFYQIHDFIRITWQTSSCFLALSLAVTLSRPDCGVGKLLCDPTLGGTIARRALPTTIIVPLLLGWLGLHLQRAELLDVTLSTSVLVLTVTAVFYLIISTNANRLATADSQRLLGEQRLRQFIEESPYAAAMFDNHMRYIFTSKKWQTDYNLGFAEIRGKSHYDVFPNLPEHWKAVHRRCLAGFVEKSSGEPYRAPDGSTHWVRWEARPWYDGRAVGGILIFTEDVTEQVRIEHDLRTTKENLEERVRERTRELEHARAASERANKFKDDFLAVLSHELRTPLTTILGWSQQMLTKGEIPETSKEALKTIERNAQVQGQLINDLLDVSRIQAGKMHLEMHPVDIVKKLEYAISTVRPTVHKKGIVIEAEYNSPKRIVMGDSTRVQQIFWNILVNAIKFTPPGGRIFVRQILRGTYVETEIRDTGSGIRPEYLPHIFERFVQGDTSMTRAHGGLGLGLTLVKNLTEMHQGTVTAASAGEGKGASFTVTFPLADQNLVPASNGRHASHTTQVRLDGIRVMVVDDDPSNLELFRDVLEGVGATVATAGSAAECRSQLAQGLPDVLVSDISMPEEDGFSLIEKLRSGPDLPARRIPAIALTAFAGPDEIRRILAAGFTAHVAKPVNRSRLIETIAKLALARGP